MVQRDGSQTIGSSPDRAQKKRRFKTESRNIELGVSWFWKTKEKKVLARQAEKYQSQWSKVRLAQCMEDRSASRGVSGFEPVVQTKDKGPKMSLRDPGIFCSLLTILTLVGSEAKVTGREYTENSIR